MSEAVLAGAVWPYAERSIDRLVVLFETCSPEARDWVPVAHQANSVAVMTSHTLANAEDNLLHAIVGDDGTYERSVDFESPERDPIAVRERWESLRARFGAALPLLPDERMLEPVSHPRRGTVTRLEVLIVVARHAAEHLAQAELTRDLYEMTAGA